MGKLVFFQPAHPIYREALYKKLQGKTDSKVIVFSSNVDFLGVKSVDSVFMNKVGCFLKIGPFYWQKKLGIPKLFSGDIAIINGNARIINYMFLLVFYRIRGIKTIWWGQGWTAGSRGVNAKFRRLMMNLANGVLVYTEKESSDLNVIPPVIGLNNGLDLDEIVDIKEHIKPRSDKRNLSLLFIGRLTSKSGIERIVETVIDLKVEVSLNVVGDYRSFSLDFPELYQRSVLSSRINWHGAIYDESRIAKIAVSCDFFIYGGAVGLSLIHAFSYYLPAIVHSNQLRHMPEFAAFEDGVNGYSFKENDYKNLSSLLVRLNSRCDFSLRMNARNTVENSFNINDMSDRFIKMIDIISD